MPPTSLASRAIRGVRWNYLGALARIAVTFVSQIALARMLGPEPFGVFGYSLLTVGMLALVVEMGLQAALVQAAALDEQTIAVAFGRMLLAGVTVAAAVFLLAEPIARYIFDAPVAAPVLRAMAPTLIVGAIHAAAATLLMRELEFKVIQLALFASYVTGYLVFGVGAAALGMGVWSLVLAWHVQTVVACAIVLAKSPRRVWPTYPLRPLPIARYGGIVMSTHVANWLIDNGPHVVVGRWLGASTLGLYTIANNLVKVPADHLLRNIQSVLHALASRAQDNDAGLRRAYLTVMGGIGVLALPTFTYVGLMSESVVLLLLGPKWQSAAAVLVPLSFAMVLHAVEGLAGPTLAGRGEPDVELRCKVAMIFVSVPVLLLTARWSLPAVGWGVAAIFLFRWIWMHAAVARRLTIDASMTLQAMRGPVVLAMLAWLVPSLVMAGLAASPRPWGPGWSIVATALPTVIVMAALAILAPRVVFGPYLLALVSGQFEKHPAWATRAGLRRFAASAAGAAAEVANQTHETNAPWPHRPKTTS